MRKLIFMAVGAAALAAASMANATSVITGGGQTLTPPDSTGFNVKVTDGPTGINDNITFIIAGTSGITDAQISTVLNGTSQNINFTSMTLDGLYSFVKTQGDPLAEAWQCCGTSVATLASVTLAPGTHTINIQGNLLGTVGSYAGTINVLTAPGVPEPATWAMMLVGFAGIGLTMRSRRRPVLAQIA